MRGPQILHRHVRIAILFTALVDGGGRGMVVRKMYAKHARGDHKRNPLISARRSRTGEQVESKPLSCGATSTNLTRVLHVHVDLHELPYVATNLDLNRTRALELARALLDVRSNVRVEFGTCTCTALYNHKHKVIVSHFSPGHHEEGCHSKHWLTFVGVEVVHLLRCDEKPSFF